MKKMWIVSKSSDEWINKTFPFSVWQAKKCLCKIWSSHVEENSCESFVSQGLFQTHLDVPSMAVAFDHYKRELFFRLVILLTLDFLHFAFNTTSTSLITDVKNPWSCWTSARASRFFPWFPHNKWRFGCSFVRNERKNSTFMIKKYCAQQFCAWWCWRCAFSFSHKHIQTYCLEPVLFLLCNHQWLFLFSTHFFVFNVRIHISTENTRVHFYHSFQMLCNMITKKFEW